MDVLSLQSALWNINVLNITFPEAQFNNASSSGNTDSSSATVTTHRPATASIFSCHAAVPGDSVAGESPSEGVGEYYDIPFPSCYTWPQIILFAAFMAVVMFVIVFGNLLVIISIMTNASLKTVQNYLLVSLAMADCCVGALIMPLSLANEVMGYWAFGDFLCDSWLKNSDQNNRPLDGEDSESYPDSKTPTSEDGSPSSSFDKKSKGVRKKDCSTQTDVVIVDEERPLYIDDDEFADSSSIMLLSEYDFDERWREFFDKHFPKEDLLIPIAKHLPNGTPKVASVAVISTTSLPFYRRALRFLVGMFRGTDASSTRGYRLQVNKDPCRVDSHTKKKSRRTLKKSFKKLHHTHTDAQNEAERRRKKMQKLKERRATLVVTLVIATFVLCWAPFFIILPLQAICGAVVCYVHPKIFSTVFWLGYFNSALNPVIYTIFNRDMRRAFKRILLGNDYTRKKETRRQRIGI